MTAYKSRSVCLVSTVNYTVEVLTEKPFGPGRPMCPATPLVPVEPAGPCFPSSPDPPWKEGRKEGTESNKERRKHAIILPLIGVHWILNESFQS